MPYINEIMMGFGCLFVVAGIIGCVIPFMPGVSLSYAGILLLHFSKYGEFSPAFLIILGVFTLLASLMDNILPVLGVHTTGGSKRAVTGSILGLIAGFFILPPLGIFIFPFFGALIAELTMGREFFQSLKTSFGAFLGLMTGIVLKLAVAGTCIFYFAKEILGYFKTA